MANLLTNLLLFLSTVAGISTTFFDLKAEAQGINFTFASFDPNNHDINYTGAASVSQRQIQHTLNAADKDLKHSVGGALYSTAIPLRLAGSDIRKPQWQLSNRFVAVEFDTHKNEWDLEHVGIDVNNITSKAVVIANALDKILGNDLTLVSGSLKNRILSARIDYDGQLKRLCVFLSNNTKIQPGNWTLPILSHNIDLRVFLPENIVVGFSSTTGDVTATNALLSWSFSSISPWNSSNSTISPRNSTNSTITPNKSKSKSKLPAKYIPIITVPLLTVFAVSAYCINRWYIKSKRSVESRSSEPHHTDHIDTDGEEMDEFFAHGPRQFTYADLSAGTNHFSEKEKLGEGGFGGVYRGILPDTKEIVAVKRVSPESKQGKKEYISEVMIISRLRHHNVVQLLGWCHQRGELLLVYEYMPNGSLDRHLFGKETGLLLSWGRRYNIACGLASALLYLHEEWDQCVLHRDVKSSNVMLDSNFNTKLGDFGLARLVEHDRAAQTTTAIAGTWGYLAPECLLTSKYSAESDVFSFGAVALEIACGRRVVDSKLKAHNMRLVDWVWDFYGNGRVLDCADPRLNAEFNGEQMERLMVVGLWCSHPHPDARPAIRQVLKVLQFEAPLPSGLPTKIPLLTYSPLPLHPDGSSSSSSSVAFSSYAKSS